MKDRLTYYDRKGRHIKLMRWRDLFEKRGYKRVLLTDVSDLRVSTVWLGIDHSMAWMFGGDTRPLIFETMIFHNGHGGDERHWATEKEARKGHWRLVNDLRHGWRPDEND